MDHPTNILGITNQYDSAFKAALHDTAIFTELVRGVIPEAKHMDDADIRSRLDLAPSGGLVLGLGNEFRNASGYGINVDLFFRIRISPDGEGPRYHYLVVEGQGVPDREKVFELRRFFYLAFLATWEKGNVFTGDRYEDAAPATCTWLVFNPLRKDRGTMVVEEHVKDYFSTVVLNLGDPDDVQSERILNILSTVFSSKMDAEEKRERLSDKFKIEVSGYLMEEMEKMNPFQEWHDYDVKVAGEENYAKGLDTGREEGHEEGRIEMCADNVRNLMSSDGINAEEAMNRLKVPEDLRPKVLSVLNDDESSSS